MTPEGLTQVPPAPDALRRAIENSKELTTAQMHAETVSYVHSVLFPVLDALSTPESLGEGRVRRQLAYSPQVDLDGKPYWLHVRQSITPDGTTGAVVIEATTYAPDEIKIAYLGQGVRAYNGALFDQDMITNSRNSLANATELREIREIADLIAAEAPRQALEKGRISPHWMERYGHRGIFEGSLDHAEGFPTQQGLYEIIAWNGVRDVCTVIEASSGKGWREGVHGEVVWPEHRVIAWREVREPYPQYYSRAKFPSLYPQPQTP